nr:PadR family transcriptional regulator [Rhodococcus sp. HNM0569]
MTPLGVTVLGLLVERPMHPYEMVQLATARRDHLVKVRPGSLYHTVTRLQGGGFVRECGTDRAGNRPERTVYEITEAGRTAFHERVADILAAPAREYLQFPLALAEAHNLDVDTVAGLLGERIAAREHELGALDDRLRAARDGGVPDLFTLGARYQQTLARAEVEWLRTLVVDIRAGAIPWLDSDEVIAQLRRPGGREPSEGRAQRNDTATPMTDTASTSHTEAGGR